MHLSRRWNETRSITCLEGAIEMKTRLLSLMPFVLALCWCGCQNSQDENLIQARAEAEAARAELARIKAAAAAPSGAATVPGPEAPAQVKVSGELFATTKGGDVKKGAGVKVYLIPITSAERELIADASGRFNALETASKLFSQGLDRKYPGRDSVGLRQKEGEAQRASYNAELSEYLSKHQSHRASNVESGLAVLLARGHVATANSDGRFEFQVPPGEYLLLTAQKAFAMEKLVWFHRVDVRDQDVSLSLDQESAVFGHSLAIWSPNLDALNVRFRHIVSAVQSLIAADLGDLIREAEERETASLAQAMADSPVRDASPSPAQEVAANSPEGPAPREPAANLTEEEERMQIIFRDWAKQRGEALKKASKMSKTTAETYMRRIDQGLVKSLTKKYDITHEELDRIEAYGARKNWWE